MTIDVEVSYDLHRYIIGQKGAGIRKMMEDYEVETHWIVLWTTIQSLGVTKFVFLKEVLTEVAFILSKRQ